jgi:transposase-like protein
LDKAGLIKELTTRLVERTLGVELTDHLGYENYRGKSL